jgi:hypothetical protein
VRGEQPHAETGHPRAGDTDELGDPTGLEVEETSPVVSSFRWKPELMHFGSREALDPQSDSNLRATHHIEHMFDSPRDPKTPLPRRCPVTLMDR